MMTESQKNIKARIFVVGYMHSGTTLLQKILGNHSGIYSSKGETKYFEHLSIIKKRFPDLRDPKCLKELMLSIIGLIDQGVPVLSLYNDKKMEPLYPESVLNEILKGLSPEDGYEKIFFKIFDALARLNSKNIWIEKTPTHILYLDEILNSGYEIKLIHIARDPRGVLASKKIRKSDAALGKIKNSDKLKFKKLEKAFDSFWDSISWRSVTRAGFKANLKVEQTDILRVSYERLAAHPKSVITDIADFLNIPYEANMENIQTHNSAYGKKEKGIFDSSLDKWKSVLSPAEIAVCQWVTSDEMKRLNCEKEKISWKEKMKVPVLLFKSFAEFFIRLYRRFKMGGSQFLLLTLDSYKRKSKNIV